MNYLTGDPLFLNFCLNKSTPGISCPKLGSIHHGEWGCKMQEIQITDSTFFIIIIDRNLAYGPQLMII